MTIKRFDLAVGPKTVTSIDISSIAFFKDRVLHISTPTIIPRVGTNSRSIVVGPIAFDPEYLYCGNARVSIKGFDELSRNGVDSDYLGQSLVASYAYMAVYASLLTGGLMFWGMVPPLVSLFELSYLYQECKEMGVEGLDKFISEVKKKIGKRNEGALKSFETGLKRGNFTPKEPQGIDYELRSKISELRVARRYVQCGYRVEYNGGLRGGGPDLIVINGPNEIGVEVRTRLPGMKDFQSLVRSAFPQRRISITERLDFNFTPTEKKNVNTKFDQGNIVVQDLTGDSEIGFRFSSRNLLFPGMKRSIRDVLEEAMDLLNSDGKPLLLFSCSQNCIEDWACVDFSRSDPFVI